MVKNTPPANRFGKMDKYTKDIGRIIKVL